MLNCYQKKKKKKEGKPLLIFDTFKYAYNLYGVIFFSYFFCIFFFFLKRKTDPFSEKDQLKQTDLEAEAYCAWTCSVILKKIILKNSLSTQSQFLN